MKGNPVIVAEAGLQTVAATVAASLPVTLGNLESGRVALVVGSGHWPQRVAEMVRDGAQGVVVFAPEPVPVADLEPIAGGNVALEWRFAADPALDALAQWQSQRGLLELTVSIGLLDSVSAVVLEVRTLLSLRWGIALGDVIEFTAGGARGSVRINAGDDSLVVVIVVQRTTARPSQLCLDWTEAVRRLRVRISSDETGRAATIEVADADGARVLPTTYESAHRASVRRVIGAARRGERLHDIERLRSVLQELEQEATRKT